MSRHPLIPCAIAVLTAVPVLAADDATTPLRATPVAAVRLRSGEEAPQRLREGSRLNDVAGHFDFAGDRIAFFPADSNDSFRVLENLALERVSRILGEGRGQPEWSVSGVITEFRGVNYLLVTKAMIKTTPAEPVAP